jgi:hypothetical protein
MNRQVIEQGISPLGIELAENVIDQKKRGGFIAAILKRFSLRDFKSEGGTALLAFRGIVRRPHSIDTQFEIIPVRTDNGLAQSGFFLLRMRQITREIVARPGKKPKLKLLAATADARISGSRKRRQNRCDFLSQTKQLRTMAK